MAPAPLFHTRGSATACLSTPRRWAVLPASIDTPLFQHAANYMRRFMKPLNPTYDPEQVAAAIVRCAERGGPREVIVGTAGKLLALQYVLAPGLSERLFRREV